MADTKEELVDEDAMQTMSVAPPDEGTPPQTPDEGLDQSMDASDPPSSTQPGGGDESEAHPS